jgi:hypothetical protein
VSQIKEFVNKLTGLQAEHQSLRLRIILFISYLISDTNLAEDIMAYTSRRAFNRVLEVQQSMFLRISTIVDFCRSSRRV